MTHAHNLAVLADYLAALPDDYAAFEMADFFNTTDIKELFKKDEYEEDVFLTLHAQYRETERRYALENGGVGKCGAVACAVGHGPSAGFLAQPEDFNCYGRFSWSLYTNRVFCPSGSEAFDWMFGGSWSYCDNTPHGAARRIRYFLAHGVPEGFNRAHPRWVEVYADA